MLSHSDINKLGINKYKGHKKQRLPFSICRIEFDLNF